METTAVPQFHRRSCVLNMVVHRHSTRESDDQPETRKKSVSKDVPAVKESQEVSDVKVWTVFICN